MQVCVKITFAFHLIALNKDRFQLLDNLEYLLQSSIYWDELYTAETYQPNNNL